MTRLQRADYPPEQVVKAIREAQQLWLSGDKVMRKCFPNIEDCDQALKTIEEIIRDEFKCEAYRNDVYQVAVRQRPLKGQEGGVFHLSIRRNDRQPIHDWRDMQEIKNQLIGPEHEAVELYPAESRLVDGANQYHLWVVPDANYRFPFGFFSERMVTETKFGDSVQRPFGKDI